MWKCVDETKYKDEWHGLQVRNLLEEDKKNRHPILATSNFVVHCHNSLREELPNETAYTLETIKETKEEYSRHITKCIGL